MNPTATLEDAAVEEKGAVNGNSGVREPVTVVLFGASGDLAKRKVIPAMYDLALHKSLGPRYAIVGFARTPMSDESFRSMAGEAAKSISEVGPIDPKKWSEFASNLYYQSGEYGNADDFKSIPERDQVGNVLDLGNQAGAGNGDFDFGHGHTCGWCG